MLGAFKKRMEKGGDVTLNKEQIAGLDAYHDFVMTFDLNSMTDRKPKKPSSKSRS